jgi:hypothetical protein
VYTTVIHPYLPDQSIDLGEYYQLGELTVEGSNQPVRFIGYISAGEYDGEPKHRLEQRYRSYYHEDVVVQALVPGDEDRPPYEWGGPSIVVSRKVFYDEAPEDGSMPPGTWQKPAVSFMGLEDESYDQANHLVAAFAFFTLHLAPRLAHQFSPDAGQIPNDDVVTRAHYAVSAAVKADRVSQKAAPVQQPVVDHAPYTPGHPVEDDESYLLGMLETSGLPSIPLIGYFGADIVDADRGEPSYFYEEITVKALLPGGGPSHFGYVPMLRITRVDVDDSDGGRRPSSGPGPGTWRKPTVDFPSFEYAPIELDVIAQALTLAFFAEKLGPAVEARFPPDAGMLTTEEMMTRVTHAVQSSLSSSGSVPRP